MGVGAATALREAVLVGVGLPWCLPRTPSLVTIPPCHFLFLPEPLVVLMQGLCLKINDGHLALRILHRG